jgi:serine/threonine protein kinase
VDGNQGHAMKQKLDELKALRESGDISEEEYRELRQAALRNNFSAGPRGAAQVNQEVKSYLEFCPGVELGAGSHRYRLLERIGQGGMGVVWKVEELTSETPSPKALKLLLPEYAEDPLAKQRLRAEAQKSMGLNHPHICKVDHWDEDATLHWTYLLMDWLDGDNLREAIRKADATQTPYSLEQVVTWLEPIAQALDYAHDRGVIHRDVKPENIVEARIILNKTDGTTQEKREMKLLDFGLAAEARSNASRLNPELLRGYSPGYQAPETEAHHRPESAQDIYALAVVAYELLTLHLPYPRGQQPHSPEPMRPEGVSDMAWAGLLKGLAYKPEERPKTARDFIASLKGDEARLHPAAGKPSPRLWTPGQVFRDAPYAPEMVVLPRGEFWMGSQEWERKDHKAAFGNNFSRELSLPDVI